MMSTTLDEGCTNAILLQRVFSLLRRPHHPVILIEATFLFINKRIVKAFFLRSYLFLLFASFLMSQFSHIEIRDSKCSIISYDAVTRSKNHKWDLQNFVVLLLLENSFTNNWTTKTKVFNQYFKEQIGISTQLSEGALRTMHRQIKGKFDYPLGEWQALKISLEKTAQSIGLELQIKHPNHGLDHRTFSTARNEDPILGRALFQPFDEQNHGIPTPPESPKIRCNQTCTIPRLGFRAFNKENQGLNSLTKFRAGIFANQNIEKPPHVLSRLYRHDARRHIARFHKGKTPFVSVTKSLVRALHIALNKEADSSIATIDLWKAGKVDIGDGDENPYIQAVSRLDLNPGDSYRGIGEYLIWGMLTLWRIISLVYQITLTILGGIDSDAIINVTTLSKLVADCPALSRDPDPFSLQLIQKSSSTGEARDRILEKRLPLNFVTGQCVGRLIQLFKIPNHLRESMVMRIVNDWKFKKYQTWRRNSDFLTGVNSEVETNVSKEKSTDWSAAFVVELKQAASGSDDIKPESRAAITSSAWTQKLAATNEEFKDDEPKTNSFWSFIDELREAAEIDKPNEDRQYDDRSSCSTIGKYD